MKLDKNSPKLKLEYPCEWTYKVIGSNEEQIRRAIAEVIQEEKYTVALSNISAKGKYCCLNVEMTVRSEESRTAMYKTLKKHPDIRLVL